jgi:non-ribosomal peptide synthetase component F
MVVGLLGVLKAGGAYVPLDPAHPTERLAYLLSDAAPAVLLTQERVRERLPPSAAKVLELDRQWGEVCQEPAANLPAREQGLSAHHLAYVIYTSGSTGLPKGVAGTHRGMVNRIAAQEGIQGFGADEICCQKTSIGFVDAIFETVGPWGRTRAVSPSWCTSIR